jgi:hypothetical protein
MLRKFLLVMVAAASLSAATLAPTPASAWYGGWRGGWGWGGGWGPGWVPAGVLDGDPAGEPVGDRDGRDLVGDGAAGAAGVGVDHVTLWPQDFTKETASFDGSSPARGVRIGFW